MQKRGGSFARKIAEAWFIADSENKRLIEGTFTQMIKKYAIWDWSEINNIEVDGIDPKDAPDFCDAFISACDIGERKATPYELEVINENNDFVYQAVQDHLY
jgi:hypothetical protein